MSSSTVVSNDKVYNIATIPGDGIGIEITEAAVQVLKRLADVSGKFKFEFKEFDWNSKSYREKGHYIPHDGIDQLKKFDAIYFGAVGWPGMDFSPKLEKLFTQLPEIPAKGISNILTRCTRSYLTLGFNATSSQLSNTICQRPTYTHHPWNQITARKL